MWERTVVEGEVWTYGGAKCIVGRQKDMDGRVAGEVIEVKSCRCSYVRE